MQTETSVEQIKHALEQFRIHREIFRSSGIRADFSLPRQHSVEHYIDRIWEFGAPNGLCSSITESKHIQAVKEPWRRSNRYEALGQMLLTNQRLDKLAASRADFAERGMLENDCLTAAHLALGSCFEMSDVCYILHAVADPTFEERKLNRKKKGKKKDQGHSEPCDADGAVNGPRVMAHMTMAATARE